MRIRQETAADSAAIAIVTERAFAGREYSSGTEQHIIAALRAAGALSLSLVAEEAGVVVGHIAFSPVALDGVAGGWYGLGPVAVAPERQGAGIGAALINAGLDELRARSAAGCVLLGDPAYYERFGFRSGGLRYGAADPRYVMGLAFGAEQPTGEIGYHEAFGADGA